MLIRNQPQSECVSKVHPADGAKPIGHSRPTIAKESGCRAGTPNGLPAESSDFQNTLLEPSTAPGRTGRPRPRPHGFTLIELLAVAVVIAVLAGMLLSLNHYVNLRSNTLRTKAEIAALGTAIEMFRTDNGTYPTSSLVRTDPTSTNLNRYGYIFAEVTNSALLYAQLVGGTGRRYFRPSSKQWTNIYVWADRDAITTAYTNVTNSINYLIDPWGKPYNYFRTYPLTTAQVNQVTYDLLSAGPDRRFNSVDDIVNWKVLQ